MAFPMRRATGSSDRSGNGVQDALKNLVIRDYNLRGFLVNFASKTGAVNPFSGWSKISHFDRGDPESLFMFLNKSLPSLFQTMKLLHLQLELQIYERSLVLNIKQTGLESEDEENLVIIEGTAAADDDDAVLDILEENYERLEALECLIEDQWLRIQQLDAMQEEAEEKSDAERREQFAQELEKSGDPNISSMAHSVRLGLLKLE